MRVQLRDWSLITGMGGGGVQNGRGVYVKFYPYEKGGGGKSFSHVEGGAQQVLMRGRGAHKVATL